MRTYPNTPAGMKAAQRAYDNLGPDDDYPPRRRRNRTITTRSGEEVSEADVDPPRHEEDEDQ